jgi:hypothetical protein
MCCIKPKTALPDYRITLINNHTVPKKQPERQWKLDIVLPLLRSGLTIALREVKSAQDGVMRQISILF